MGRQRAASVTESLLNEAGILVLLSEPIVIRDQRRDTAGVELGLHPCEVRQQAKRIIGPASAAQADLQRLALQKLKARLRAKA